MKPRLAFAVLLLVTSLGIASWVVPDWSTPLECRRVGNRMVC